MPIESELEQRWKYWVPQPMPDDAAEHAPDSVRTLKLLDPACGSGHFLVIAFDLLFHLYREESLHRGETWTDAQIVTAIREGRRPDGRILGPPMPYYLYRDVSDDDMAAIVAYLRSIKPVRNKVPPSQYRMPLPPAWGPPITGPVSAPPKSDKVAYGAYLAGPMGHCIDCHTPMVEGGRRDFANRTGAGGFLLAGPYGEVVSANITPHPETGIGTWTDAQIKRAITEGVRADGTALSPPMGYAFYKTMRGEDLDALVAYLRSLKPVDNKVR